ncbi:MAG: LysR family transcriptional regulator [Betaproteobacteria bacterium]|nr:LysR family transcriptional regulator [Betaproteobacteria bacterium]
MLKLSLEAVQIIDAIDREGSFSGAAERLHRVPSSISYSVSKLEEQLGFPLFMRKGVHISLTPAGAELLREGRWLVGAASDLESRLKRIATGFESELRLVHDSVLSTAALLDDIKAFSTLNCSTRLRVSTEVLTGTWEALRERRADLVIAAGHPPAVSDFQVVPVGTLEFGFYVAPDHPLAESEAPLSVDDLYQHTAIAVGDSARSLPARSIGIHDGQVRITVPDMATKLQMQQAGLGHGFLPKPYAAKAVAEGSLVELEVQDTKPQERFWLAWCATDQGEALKWWQKRLSRPLLPDLLG